jgi:transcriptional regulator with XRE-family HTH domain
MRSWRKRNGLTVREAAARIVINGAPVDHSSWHAWETGRKIPRDRETVLELERVVGVQPNDYYPRPDAAEIMSGPVQPALL